MELKGLKCNFGLMVKKKKLEHISDKVIQCSPEAPNLFRKMYEFLITAPSLHI